MSAPTTATTSARPAGPSEASLPTARRPVLEALLGVAREKGWTHGVLGVRARPEWSGPATFVVDGTATRVVACASTLAVREALLGRAPGEYLVVLTDREESELGAGVLSHLIFHRLRTPDPWDAVRQQFAATGLESALTRGAGARDVATGLLAAEPPGGWPPAVGGILTRDHALGALARHHLGWTQPFDLQGVLAWTTGDDVTARLADLRSGVGAALTEALLDWVAATARVLEKPLRHLLASGSIGDAAALGVVAGLLTEVVERGSAGESDVARLGLVRLEARTGPSRPSGGALRTWAREAGAALDAAPRPRRSALLARADELLRAVEAGGVAGWSATLPSGLHARLGALGSALRDAVPGAALTPVSTAAGLAEVERRWTAVEGHRLARSGEHPDPRVATAAAAVRLARWLGTPAPDEADGSLAEALGRHRDDEAWADAAAADIAAGIGDPDVDAALESLLLAAAQRRRTSDRRFARALADHARSEPVRTGAGAVPLVEDVLADLVLPLARRAPALLLVLDGMSVAVATEVVADVTATGAWTEALPAGHDRRGAVLAVLPTLTTASRTSLLTGELTVGGQHEEQRGYAALTTAHGLAGSTLFHKKPLDSTRPGFGVADDVGAAIADVDGSRLVTCVLNTVDDALDRSDPGGTHWGADAVKHLRPLLNRAERVGRVVVLLSDHGHVIERRRGHQRSHPAISSARSRDAEPPAGEDEVLVEGRRVLLSGGRAVLAVDEDLRFGPLKAGYHGGASPAEAVIPVVVLVPAVVPDDSGLRLAPPQSPTWWSAPLANGTARSAQAAPEATPPPLTHTDDGALFDLSAPAAPSAPVPLSAPAADAAPPGAALVAAVTSSEQWRAQRSAAPRVKVGDDAVGALLGALLAAPGDRLGPVAAARALGVPEAGVRGPLRQVQQLLNVEGYVVLGIDADGVTVTLDEALLREQFEIAP